MSKEQNLEKKDKALHIGVVSHSTNIQRDFSKKWNELTINEKIDFAGKKNFEDSHTAEFLWNYYHHKYCG